jgi:hypothetical protein
VKLTSAEAAEVLGIGTSGLRDLVHRGRLKPITRGARPLTFHAVDVYDLQVARRSPAERAWHDALWAEIDRVVAGHP